MRHVIKEFDLGNGLYASHDTKDAFFLFRIYRKRGRHFDLYGSIVVTEHDELGVLECYCEAANKKDELNLDLEVFKVLFEDLKFHIAWFKRNFEATPAPMVISDLYVKNKYGGIKGLMEKAKSLKGVYHGKI